MVRVRKGEQVMLEGGLAGCSAGQEVHERCRTDPGGAPDAMQVKKGV